LAVWSPASLPIMLEAATPPIGHQREDVTEQTARRHTSPFER
jgi:hypothetical protein